MSLLKFETCVKDFLKVNTQFCIFQVLLEASVQTRVIYTTTESVHGNQFVTMEMCCVVSAHLLPLASVNHRIFSNS